MCDWAASSAGAGAAERGHSYGDEEALVASSRSWLVINDARPKLLDLLKRAELIVFGSRDR